MVSPQANFRQRLGALPNLFHLVPGNPEAASGLCAFACVAYLDNPLPVLFRERLCVWLSRSCEVRYCAARHAGFLVALEGAGVGSGFHGRSGDDALRLLGTPLPRGTALHEHIDRCSALVQPVEELPPSGCALEMSLFACATHVFLQTHEAARCLAALTRALGTSRTQHVLLLQTFLRHEHDLSRTHPELPLDDDVEQLLLAYPDLRQRLFEDPEIALAGNIGSDRGPGDMSSVTTRAETAETATRLQQELDDSRLLHEISNELIREQQINALYGKIVDAAARLMRSQFATMQMDDKSDAGARELRLLAHHGLVPEAVQRWQRVSAESATTCGVALLTGKRVIVPDVQLCDFIVRSPELSTFLAAGIRAVQTTPLCSRDGTVVGMISTHWSCPHEPSERELHLLDILARQAADLIERTRIEEVGRRNDDRQAFLLGLSDTLRPLTDDAAIQGQAVRMLGEHLDVTWSFYFELEPDAEYDVVRQDHVRRAARSVAGRYRLEDAPTVANALRAGRPLAIADVTASPLLTDADRVVPMSLSMRAYLCVPLVKHGAPVGLLTVADASPRSWTADEIALVGEVGERTWVAIEHARAEASLIESGGRLRDADRMKDQFLATLAHELRNPLAPIRNGLHLLRLSSPATNSAKVLEMLDRQVDHIIRLVDDLLEVSRITRGTIDLKRETLDLASVLKTAVEASLPLIERARHRLELKLPDGPLPVYGDAVRLTQVFSNLLNNAARYTDDGGKIELTARSGGDAVSVDVRDNGIGLAPEQLSRLFQMFVQVDPGTTRAQGGLGIGLSLAQRLVQMHGGSIIADSPGLGYGSCFTVTLPLSHTGTVPGVATRHAGSADLDNLRVMIVDDNPDARDSLGMLIGCLGADVRVMPDGASALEALDEYRPAVGLLDIGMPGMDGYEVARRIRADSRNRAMTLVALTGWGQAQDREHTRAAGFAHHLVKPVDLTVLETLLAGLQAKRGVRVHR